MQAIAYSATSFSRPGKRFPSSTAFTPTAQMPIPRPSRPTGAALPLIRIDLTRIPVVTLTPLSTFALQKEPRAEKA